MAVQSRINTLESDGNEACLRQVDTAQAGKRGKFSRWLARYKRRMDFKMLAIGDGEQAQLLLQTRPDTNPTNVTMFTAPLGHVYLQILAIGVALVRCAEGID